MRQRKRTLHLVYAVPYEPSRLRRKVDGVRRRIAHMPASPHVPWRRGGIFFKTAPPPSPYSITINLLHYLRQHYNVLLYDWQETQGSFAYGKDDILIGHLAPETGTVMRRFVECEKPAAAKILLQPYATGILDDVAFVLPYMPRVDAFATICGTYWSDVIDTTPFAPYKDRMRRVDMAIDTRYYPLLKKRFNPPGARAFLYIGNNSKPAKGCAHLSRLAASLPGTRFAWIGNGPEIENLTRLSTFRPLTPSFMASICNQFDAMITMGTSDANPTTILEAMAWGLLVLCTPQSGYYEMDEIYTVHLDDQAANQHLVARLQQMPQDSLEARSQANRAMVARHYTWERFCTSIADLISDVLERRM